MTSNEQSLDEKLLQRMPNPILGENDVKNEIISDVEEKSATTKAKGRRKSKKRPKKVGHDLASFKVEAEYSDDENVPDATILMLKSLVNEVDVSILWEAVKDKILPSLKIWNVLIEKVSSLIAPQSSPNDKLSWNDLFASKVNMVLQEVESILRRLKMMIDSCLIPNDDQQQADGIEIRPSSSMCRALNKPVDSSFRVFEDKRAEFNLFFDGSANYRDPQQELEESEVLQSHLEHLDCENEFVEADDSEDSNSPRFLRQSKSEPRIIVKKQHGPRKDNKRQSNKPFRKDAVDKRYYCTFPGCVSGQIKNWTCSSGVWKHFLNFHNTEVTGKSFCLFSCDNCDRKFPTKALLNQHQKEKHVNHFEFVCNICAKRLPTNVALQMHLRMHSGEKPFSCDLCNYRSIRQAAVNQHKIRMHENDVEPRLRKHVCDKCGKTFKERCKLREHIKTHEEVRTFLCGFCGKGLKNKQSLNRHMYTHGMKNECSNCGKFFSTPNTLAIHQRDKHGMSI